MGDKVAEDTEGYDANGANVQGVKSNEQNHQQPSEDIEGQQKQQKQLYDQWIAMNGSVPGMNNGVYGFDGVNSGFPNMGLNGSADFNQMMQFMPNGMQNGSMGAFPNMMCKLCT